MRRGVCREAPHPLCRGDGKLHLAVPRGFQTYCHPIALSGKLKLVTEDLRAIQTVIATIEGEEAISCERETLTVVTDHQ